MDGSRTLSSCDPKQAPSSLSFFQYQQNDKLQSMSGCLVQGKGNTHQVYSLLQYQKERQ